MLLHSFTTWSDEDLVAESLVRINALREDVGLEGQLIELEPGVRNESWDCCLLGSNLDCESGLAQEVRDSDPCLRELERRFEAGLLPELTCDAYGNSIAVRRINGTAYAV